VPVFKSVIDYVMMGVDHDTGKFIWGAAEPCLRVGYAHKGFRRFDGRARLRAHFTLLEEILQRMKNIRPAGEITYFGESFTYAVCELPFTARLA
jgi:hypothetical protein